MAGKSTRLTLQDIADHTGYGRSTVSLALRDHPSLTEKTRRTIQAAARELGYVPNPLLAVLMSQLKGKRNQSEEIVAVIVKSSGVMRQIELGKSFYGILYKAMAKKAAEMGFRLDCFCLETLGMSGERLSKVLMTRGIHGVMLFPGGAVNQQYLDLNWDYFATVLVGFNKLDSCPSSAIGAEQPNFSLFNQIVPDYAYDIDLALAAVRRHMPKRLGMVIPESRNRGCDYQWVARFLLFQQELPVRSRLPLFRSNGDHLDAESVVKWVERYRPDLLLIAGDEVHGWLVDAGYHVPEDIRLINLVERGEVGLAGIDPRTDEVGAASVELLASLLQSSQFGIPRYPRTIAIKGAWVRGASFPED